MQRELEHVAEKLTKRLKEEELGDKPVTSTYVKRRATLHQAMMHTKRANALIKELGLR